MGVPYLGDFKEDDTVLIVFNTFTSNDPSASCTITNFANTDVHIHKEDDLTQRNNAAGITVSVDFDGITGSHMIKIDTNDNTVAGFWVTGKDYFVRIEGTTIDGATINVFVGHFSIENRFQEVDVVKWLGQACHAVSENGVPKVDLDQIGGVVQSATDLKDFADAGYDPATNKVEGVKLVDTTTTNTDMKGTDGANTVVPDAAGTAPTAAEIKTAMEAEGTSDLDAIADAVAHGTHGLSALQVLIAALQTDLDNGTDGLGALKTLIDAIPTVTEIQTEMEENGASLLDTIRDIVSHGTYGNSALQVLIAALQTDLDNGTDGLGALKALIDALNNISTAQVNTEVDNALNTAIPGAPTANSINEYIQKLKWNLVNKMVITEANGNTVIYKDDDIAEAANVAAAFDSDGTDTTRKRLE